MIGLDTNVLVRLVTRDDATQTRQAQAIVAAADDRGLYVSLVVLAELAWVLRRAYRYEAAAVLNAIEGVLDGREFLVERQGLAWEALATARAVRCGYADALIERMAREVGAVATLTFEIKAKRLPTMRDAATFG
jgi:predicted nucleic-acid-binding protein